MEFLCEVVDMNDSRCLLVVLNKGFSVMVSHGEQRSKMWCHEVNVGMLTPEAHLFGQPGS